MSEKVVARFQNGNLLLSGIIDETYNKLQEDLVLSLPLRSTFESDNLNAKNSILLNVYSSMRYINDIPRIVNRSIGRLLYDDEPLYSLVISDTNNMKLSLLDNEDKLFKYEGYIKIDIEGEYTFSVEEDKQHELIIDGDTILSGPDNTTYKDIYLTEGFHKFIFMYSSRSNYIGFDVNWRKPNESYFSQLPFENLYCIFKPLVKDNVTLSRNGVNISNATNNLVKDPSFSTMDNDFFINKLGSENYKINDNWDFNVIPYQDVNVLTGMDIAQNGGYLEEDCVRVIQKEGRNEVIELVDKNSYSLNEDLDYTVSVYCKCNNTQTSILEVEFEDGTFNESSYHSGSGNWERLNCTFIAKSNIKNIKLKTCGSIQSSITYWSSLQLEELPYASAFTDSCRESDGNIRYNLPYLEDMSIMFNYYPYQNIRSINEEANNPIIINISDYNDDKSISLRATKYNDKVCIKLYIKNNSESWQDIVDIMYMTEEEWLSTHNWVISFKDQINFNECYIYHNAQLVKAANIEPKVMFDYDTFINWRSKHSNNCNATISDLSVYNKSLNVDEVNSLYLHSLSIDRDGNIFNVLEEGLNVGSGKDGNKTVDAKDEIVNVYSHVLDNIQYGDISLRVNSGVGFNKDDEVLIIQMQDYKNKLNVGNYEFNYIDYVRDNIIYLKNEINGNYTSGIFNSINSQCTQIVRVPNFKTLTVLSTGSITCKKWDGYSGGILIFRSLSGVDNYGKIEVNGKGYRGGRYNYLDGYVHPNEDGECGEGYTGRGLPGFYNNNTPYAKDGGGCTYINGSGGSYCTFGQIADKYENTDNIKSKTYGHHSLFNWYLGSGGGGGKVDNGQPHGGNGGGIISIFSTYVNGVVQSNGQDAYFGPQGKGSWGSGGGSGGSVYIECEQCECSISVDGGSKMSGNLSNGGNGGLGYSYTNIRQPMSQEMSILKDKIIMRSNVKELQNL